LQASPAAEIPPFAKTAKGGPPAIKIGYDTFLNEGELQRLKSDWLSAGEI
jgi:hypothetical protein